MKFLIGLSALVLSLNAAHAQDRAKSDFQQSAEYRVRFFHTQNPAAESGVQGSDNLSYHRFKWDGLFKANERFAANFSLIHTAEFGQTSTDELGENNAATGGVEQNFLAVNQAYMSWMVSEDTVLKFGRMAFQIGDGSVMGINDWEQTPYSFEGLAGIYEAEFGKFSAFAFKYREIELSTTVESASADPEHNAYGLSFDLKTMPDFLKVLNLHLIKDAANAVYDETGSGVRSLTGQNTLRYGMNASMAYGIMEFNLWYAAQTGNYSEVTATAKTDRNAVGQMYQVEVAANFETFMGTRLWARYHGDSGDKDAADGSAGTYDGYFTEKHGSTGMMDLFGWGNMTFLTLGFTTKPMDRTVFGLAYWNFSRTEANATAASATFTPGTMGTLLSAGPSDDEDLGYEIDAWATHEYDTGLIATLRAGYFVPGDYFRNQTAVAAAPPDPAEFPGDDGILQLMVEGKMTF